MTPETRARVKQAFFEVIEAPPSERARILDLYCGDDPAARSHVERLLAAESAHAASGEKSFLETPVLSRDEDEQRPGVASEPSLDLVGEIANGEYTLIRKIGEGGMGAVYEARQRSPNRRVAIKFLRSGIASRDVLRRFQHESEILGQLDHPGIARIYQAGTTAVTYSDGTGGHAPYFAMEFIEGQPINTFAEHHSLPIRERLCLLADLCEAVEHAHQKGVIHRDLKPANVLVSAEGSSDHPASNEMRFRPRVLDFGVARLTQSWDQDLSVRTEGVCIVGTPAYMSPEQLSGEPGKVDTRSDVYALGVIGYELLSGRLPIDMRGSSISQAERLIAEREPARLGTIRPELRGDAETIIAKALEKEQSHRYSSAAELAADIRRSLRDEPIVARPMTARTLTERFVRRNRGKITVACLVILLVIASLSYGLVLARIERDKARLAETEAKNQSRITNAVSTFINEDVLAAADPYQVPDPNITMRAVLDSAAAKIENRFPDDPLVEAGVRMTLGSTYMNLARHEEAALHLERALTLRRKNLPPDHTDTILTLNRLGETRYRAGDLAGAAEAFAACVESCRRATPRTRELDVLLINLSGNLGFITMKLGKLEEAEPLLVEAVRLLRQHDPDSPELVPSLMNLAMLHMDRSHPAAAVPLLKEAIELGTTRLGPENPITLLAIQNLAAAYNIQERYAEAIPLLEEVLAVQVRVLGENHPQALTTLGNLGYSLVRSGDIARAEPMLERAYARRLADLGERHHHTLISVHSLAVLREAQGKIDEAERLFLQGESLSRGAGGERGSMTMRFVRTLEKFYQQRGDAEKAEYWRARAN